MHKSGKAVGFWSAVAIGIGSMVGAGIFALLGEAGAITASATYISFFMGGIIALLSGYSIGRLGATYPSSGGIVEYLGQAFGVGIFSGAMSILMYIAAIVSIAMVAKAFGAYAFSMMPEGYTPFFRSVFAVGIVFLFVAINLGGAKNMVKLENIVVLIKMIVLVGLAVAGIFSIEPSRLVTSTYPPVSSLFYSLTITFFAYEGFRVITNAAEDMPNPAKTLPRAIMTSIGIVMVLYIAIALVVFGNLPVAEVLAAKDFALAEAAKPVFGSVGFTVVAIAALIATASSINANLYAVTNVTYQLAKNGQLPTAFGKPIKKSREGLVISAFFIILIALFLDLGEIAVLGSISILIVHFITHVGHMRLIHKTGASRILVISAALVNLAAIILALFYESTRSPHIVIMIVSFLLLSFLIETVLRMTMNKKIELRIEPHDLKHKIQRWFQRNIH